MSSHPAIRWSKRPRLTLPFLQPLVHPLVHVPPSCDAIALLAAAALADAIAGSWAPCWSTSDDELGSVELLFGSSADCRRDMAFWALTARMCSLSSFRFVRESLSNPRACCAALCRV